MSGLDTQAVITRLLAVLAASKNQNPRPEVYEVYAQRLAVYPLEAVRGACEALMDAPGAFFPPLGVILEEMTRWLRGTVGPNDRSVVLAPDEAWKVVRRLVASYQPQSRPNPTCDNPAINAAIRQIGGVLACQWEDHVGEGIVRRAFLKEYETQINSPEHIQWALSPASSAPTVVFSLELPKHEIAALMEAANRTGTTGVLAYLLEGERRAAVLDGSLPPYALPAPNPTPLTKERRAELREEVLAGIRSLARAWSMERTTTHPVNEDSEDDGRGYPIVDVSRVLAEGRDAVAYRRDQERQRKERYG